MDESRTHIRRVRLRLLLAVAVLTIAGAVWGVSQTQRSAADRSFAASRAGQQMLTAMLDQETGLRGFALSGEEEFLEPFVRGEGDFEAARSRAPAGNVEPERARCAGRSRWPPRADGRGWRGTSSRGCARATGAA